MRAKKVDANQEDIINALRKIGCEVESLAALGSGVPDLLVGLGGRLFLLEVKNPEGKNKILETQTEFSKRFKVYFVRSVEEALEAVTSYAK